SDLVVKVPRDLLPRDRVLHRLPVLPDDPEILEPRGHAAAAPGQVGVVPILTAPARLSLDADVVGAGAEPLRRLTLRGAAAASSRHEPFTLAEVLVLGAHPVTTGTVAPTTAAFVLSPPAQPLARALRLVHCAHLVERLLHRVERPIRLAALERLHAFHRVTAPIGAALAAEPLHLLEELAELLGRDLIGAEAAGQRFRLPVHHLVLAVGEVRLEVGQAVHLLEHPKPLVTLLHEAVEVRALARERGVLEDRREVTSGRGAAAPGPLREVALLEGRALERVLRERARRLLEHRRARTLFTLFLARRQKVGEAPRW